MALPIPFENILKFFLNCSRNFLNFFEHFLKIFFSFTFFFKFKKIIPQTRSIFNFVNGNYRKMKGVTMVELFLIVTRPRYVVFTVSYLETCDIHNKHVIAEGFDGFLSTYPSIPIRDICNVVACGS